MNLSKLDEERRQALLNSALKEFAVKGYDDASTNTIAKNACISKALMFHYVHSKEELFLFLMDYCQEAIDREYLSKMDFTEKDIFKKLRQSYLLQINLLKKNPWILDFNNLSDLTKSEQVNKSMKEKANQKEAICFETLFHAIDETKFKEILNIDSCKQLIFWGNIGFTNQLIEDMRSLEYKEVDYHGIIRKIDNYFADLMEVFYA
ncbi:TetR/AcrR family transcriptional regulator [Enterococcus sp. BWM-S5]|uniref:TetR/AcrR family transcriptional regulator n=1 Tax=Enterococcus larvae TaxID=2794352 RepID=A0ABS4CK41_9ENTE|nr:TetR/AcrR family transcriptional regulator [Enterococcus larvae]MBP1046647.1 TetR/AcrR family transcriptional regulator [Enterococcus larvae]